jgi:hypothetical protein
MMVIVGIERCPDDRGGHISPPLHPAFVGVWYPLGPISSSQLDPSRIFSDISQFTLI